MYNNKLKIKQNDKQNNIIFYSSKKKYNVIF